MTVGDFYDCIDGFELARERQIQDADMLNHKLGQYIGIAFSDPKHYPKNPEIAESLRNKNKPHRIMTDAEMLAQIKRDSLQWKGITNGSNS